MRSLQRRAKYLLVELESGETLLMHLGMSGSFRVVKGSRDDIQGSFYFERSRLDAHDHVLFTMSSGATIVFNDPRRFGLMSIVPAGELTNDRALKVSDPSRSTRPSTRFRWPARSRERRRSRPPCQISAS